jgi:hypothetical protein
LVDYLVTPKRRDGRRVVFAWRDTVQTSKAADGILSRFRQGIFAIATSAR